VILACFRCSTRSIAALSIVCEGVETVQIEAFFVACVFERFS
jgi:hypothetical protein